MHIKSFVAAYMLFSERGFSYGIKRCIWAETTQYVEYHDKDKPLRNNDRLFEALSLEQLNNGFSH
jgi:hypothetical protein